MEYPSILAHRRLLTQMEVHLRAYSAGMPDQPRYMRGSSGLNWAWQQLIGHRPAGDREPHNSQARAILSAANLSAEGARDLLRALDAAFQEALSEVTRAGHPIAVGYWLTGHTAMPAMSFAEHVDTIRDIEDWIEETEPGLLRSSMPQEAQP